eukprot:XP_025012763.1 protein YLS3-like [Ricinus communis]
MASRGRGHVDGMCRGSIWLHYGLAPCVNYATGSSSTPSSSCCSRLASVVQSQPRCLRTVLNGGGGASLGVTIYQTLALAVPELEV